MAQKWVVKFADMDQEDLAIRATTINWNDGVVTAVEDGMIVAMFNAGQVLGVMVEAESDPNEESATAD